MSTTPVTPPLLEIHIHLANGNTHRFVQNDPQAAGQIVQKINARIFETPSLTLVGENLVATYPSAQVRGISLRMEPLPEALLSLLPRPQSGVQDIREIAQDDYQAKCRLATPVVAGQSFMMLNGIEFTGGERLWVETEVQSAASGIQERQILQHIFSGACLVCRGLDGGLNLWNRAHMVSYTFCPKPDVPIGFWPAELVKGLT